MVAQTKAAALLNAHYIEDLVELAALHIDPTYQRPTSPGRLKEMLPFNPDTCGCIDVNRRPDASLFIMDGGHRAALARLSGEDWIAAHLFAFATVEEEATFYEAKNKHTRPPTALQRLRALIRASDPDAVALDTLVRNAGYQWDETRGMVLNGITCAYALRKIYDRSPEELDAVLHLAHDTWGDRQGCGAEVLLNAVSQFVRKYGTVYDRGRFIRRLSLHDPLWLKSKAGEAHSARAGLTADSHLCNLLVDLYDQHKRTNRLRLATED